MHLKTRLDLDWVQEGTISSLERLLSAGIVCHSRWSTAAAICTLWRPPGTGLPPNRLAVVGPLCGDGPGWFNGVVSV